MLLLETDGTLWYNSGIYATTYSELSDYDEAEPYKINNIDDLRELNSYVAAVGQNRR